MSIDELNKLIDRFLFNIQILTKGEQTALKRSLGKGYLNANSKAMLAFAKSIPQGIREDQEFIWFEVACMYALHDCKTGSTEFVKCLYKIDKGTQLLDRKMENMLGSSLTEESLLMKTISKLVKRLETEGITPDFKKLIRDLISWFYEDVTVKLWWAKNYKNTKGETNE